MLRLLLLIIVVYLLLNLLFQRWSQRRARHGDAALRGQPKVKINPSGKREAPRPAKADESDYVDYEEVP